MGSLLIQNGTLLTLGESGRVLEGQALLIEGDCITRIGPNETFTGAYDQVIDAHGKVVMPGLVNAHMHFYSTLVRGLGKAAPSRNFQEVLEHLWWRLDRKLCLDDIHVSAQVAALNAIRRGTTTLVDHHASPGAVRGSLDTVAKAVKVTGLRACLCYELSDRDGEAVVEEGLEENAAFIQRCGREKDPQLRALFGLHAAFTLSDPTLERAVRRARELGVGFHVHVAEAASDVAYNLDHYGKRVVERLAEHAVFGEDTLAVHCVHLADNEIEILARTGTTVVHNPQSNLNNAVGIADLVGMVRRGVRVGLGTDAMTVDMLEELRVALWAQRLRREDPSCGFQEATDTLFRHNPAIASRLWGMPIGELKVGAAADVILVDYHPPTPLTDATALGHLVYGLSQATVDTTICAGRILMQGKALCLDIDEEALAERSRELATRLWERF